MSKEFKLPHDHNNALNGQRIFETLPDLASIEIVADAMKQLGDPTRLRIFWLLCHTEECVVNIASIIEMTNPASSSSPSPQDSRSMLAPRAKKCTIRPPIPASFRLRRSMEEIMRINASITNGGGDLSILNCVR